LGADASGGSTAGVGTEWEFKKILLRALAVHRVGAILGTAR
jgi:hypothetical protein